MKPFNHLSSAVFPLLLIVGCTPVESRDFFPDDGLDDAEELQAEIDATAAMGGGTVALDNGTYNLSRPVYLRDNVVLQGNGPKTILTNEGLNGKSTWGGVTLFAGNLAAASFTYNGGRGHRGYRGQRTGAASVRFADCTAPTTKPVAGDVVWLASEKGEEGRGGWHRPYSGEMHLVTSISDCTITFADPVEIANTHLIDLHWPETDRVRYSDVERNRPIKFAAVRNLQLRSSASQAMLTTGCYKCVFDGLTIGRSRRLLAVQGMRNGIYRNISGMFEERGIEFAMFATNNVVENISGRYEPRIGYPLRPVVRLGESSRDNVIRNVQFNLLNAADVANPIRFDESSNNILEDIVLTVNDDARPPKFIYRPEGAKRGQSLTLPAGTNLRGVKQCSRIHEAPKGSPTSEPLSCEEF